MNQSAGILSTGSHLPDETITNQDLEKSIDTSNEWIVSRTGIRERRVSKKLTVSDMGAIAGKKALENARLKPAHLDLIIVTSLSYEKLCPSTASIVQEKLQAHGAAAFDVTSACAGFSYALTTAFSLVESGHFKKILLIGSENISKFINWGDRNTCILFGDGAGAVVVGKTEAGYGHLASYLACDGRKQTLIEIPAGGSGKPATTETVKSKEHYLQMNGREVFKFAVKAIPDAVNHLLDKTGLKIEDIDLLVPHQANMRIIESASKKLGVPLKKFYTNMEFYGNTSTASVPLALDEIQEKGILEKGSNVILIGFGGGLSWGANLVKWSI